LCVHFAADLLCGSVFLRNFSSFLLSLLPIVIAFFASLLLIRWVHTSKFKEEILVLQLTNVLRHLLHHLESISTGSLPCALYP
jgi:hypothetical protein